MSQDCCAERASEPTAPALLRSGYVELKEVEEALRQAEAQLVAAHRQANRLQTQRTAEALYRDILALRDRSRRVLAELGEIWVNSN